MHQHEQSDLSAGAAIEALRQIMKDAPDANVRIVVSVVGHVPIPKCSGETLPRGAMTVKHTRPLHSQAENIIGKFGGIRATARMAGFPVTTVQRWKESGRINPDYNDRILEAAAANGIVLTVEDVSTVDPSHPLLGAPVADPAEPVEVGVP
ncbi:hypothetical protein GCM10017653_47250 [Ancylobacter defluvii]|uniref:Uncharacterized protein n=1 Tax=Ancylobacter defluvii TaxID=1282440 RepID=A0A9W6JZB8_9HYPH|nr:hypothetical protein GCM10017653_47250 [Ancylobacter defluvii]